MTPEQIRMLAEKSYKTQEEAEAFIQGYNYKQTTNKSTYEDYELNIWAAIAIIGFVAEFILFFYFISKQ